jgi:hypothetical protein
MIADTLLQQMRQFVGAETPLFLDVAEVNEEAVAMAEEHGMKPVFETARMYTQGAPNLPLHKIFWVTSFELG